jgi:uncharacterized protein involved in exopolysaccharide biosynthesis
MNQLQTLNPQDDAQHNDEIEVVDLLIVIAKFKKPIVMVTMAAAALSLAISFVLPKEFKATTKVLPPQQTQSSAAALLSQLGGIAGAAAGAAGAGLKNPNDLYIGMLKSRTVADHLIARFNLMKLYRTESMDQARKLLEANTNITSGKDGLITIEFENEDKKLVAPLANAYVSELFGLMKTLAVTDASQRRLFYEHQLQSTKDNLANAEAALKRTMDAHGVISVDSESRTVLETVARLRAQASAKEIQLASMGAFLTPTHPDYRRASEELASLRAELSKLENGSGASVEGTGNSSSGLENIKLLRDLKYQQMLYEVLAKQYEVARIDEAKDPSLIQVLDSAVEPERKSKPRRGLIIMLSTTFALFGSICWAFMAESRRKKLLTPEGAAQWAELRSHLGFGRAKRG